MEESPFEHFSPQGMEIVFKSLGLIFSDLGAVEEYVNIQTDNIKDLHLRLEAVEETLKDYNKYNGDP